MAFIMFYCDVSMGYVRIIGNKMRKLLLVRAWLIIHPFNVINVSVGLFVLIFDIN